MSTNSIKELIESELSILVGKQVRQFWRAALMLGVDVGKDVEYTYKTGPQQGEVTTRSKYALHVHSAWRLFKDGDICLSQSAMFTNMNGFRWCDDTQEVMESLPFTEISERLNEVFETETICTLKIEANEQGDLMVHMDNGYCLEVFADSIGDTESWRFFEVNSEKHFVVFEEE